jgi:hypothetical protein
MFTVGITVWVAVAVVGFVAVRWRRLGERLEPPTLVRLYWLGLAAAGMAGVAQLIVPAPPDVVDPGDFAVDRARAHIDSIAAQPRPIGSPANEEVRTYLIGELIDLGLEPRLQETTAPDWFGGSGTALPVVNVMARVPGTDSTGTIAVVAHFDTVPATPGANDDASGVAVALETATSLARSEQRRNDVILLFTDGEEPAPRYGATAFVERHEWFDEVRFVVNLEAIGTGGPSWLTAMNGPQSWVLERYADGVGRPAAYSFLTETTELIGGSNSDFATFRDAGVPGVEFVYARGSSIYHSAADTPDSVSSRSLFSHGANTVDLVRRMADDDLSAPTGDDVIFFTVGHGHLLHYPAWWAIPSAAIGGAALVETARRRRSLTTIVRHAAVVTTRLSVAVVVASLVWTVVASWRETMGIVEGTVYLAGLSLLTATVVSGRSAIHRRNDDHARPEAVLLVFWILGLVLAVAAPGASYLFVLPPLAGVLALPFEIGSGDGRPPLGPAVATVGAWLILAIPAIDVFYQFAQPRPGNPGSEVLPVVAVSVLLVGLGAALASAFRVSSTGGVALIRPGDLRPSAPGAAPDRGPTPVRGAASSPTSTVRRANR